MLQIPFVAEFFLYQWLEEMRTDFSIGYVCYPSNHLSIRLTFISSCDPLATW